MEKDNKFKMSKGLYISLAICMLLVAGIGIFASVKSISKTLSNSAYSSADIEDENIGKGLFAVDPHYDDVSAPDENMMDAMAEEPRVFEFAKPVNGEITKPYSGEELVYSDTMEDYRTHRGVDISSATGEPVCAIESGMITKASIDPIWGMTIEIDHGDGMVSRYQNISDELPEGIEAGAYVEKGGIIASVGNGSLVEMAEDDHIHLEMMKNNELVDPQEYIK